MSDDWWRYDRGPRLPDWHVDIEFVVAAEDEEQAYNIVRAALPNMGLRWEPHEVFPAIN